MEAKPLNTVLLMKDRYIAPPTLPIIPPPSVVYEFLCSIYCTSIWVKGLAGIKRQLHLTQ
jgi:hypothetical protein